MNGKISFPKILQGCEDKDIFNLDETSLFFCALPNKTLKTVKFSVGKIGKERLTVMVCVGMNGKFEKL